MEDEEDWKGTPEGRSVGFVKGLEYGTMSQGGIFIPELTIHALRQR